MAMSSAKTFLSPDNLLRLQRHHPRPLISKQCKRCSMTTKLGYLSQYGNWIIPLWYHLQSILSLRDLNPQLPQSNSQRHQILPYFRQRRHLIPNKQHRRRVHPMTATSSLRLSSLSIYEPPYPNSSDTFLLVAGCAHYP